MCVYGYIEDIGFWLIKGDGEMVWMENYELSNMADKAGITREEIRDLHIQAIRGSDNPQDYANNLPNGRIFVVRVGGGNFEREEFFKALSFLKDCDIKPKEIFLTASCCMQCDDLSFAFEIASNNLGKFQVIPAEEFWQEDE